MRGAAVKWLVTAWTTGGNVPDAIIRLEASPSSAAATFSFGCGTSDGTASCDLGAMDAKSVPRQLQAQTLLPATASTVDSVKITVIGSAAKLQNDPQSSATIQINGTATPTSIPTPTTSPLPIGSLPGVSATSSATLSPGGNAGGLFPTLSPSAGTASGGTSSGGTTVKGRPVANTTALPEGASVVGASLIGLAALALAFVLAVTRLSIRRRPAPAPAAPQPTSADSQDPGAENSPATTSEPPNDASTAPEDASGTQEPPASD